MRTQAPGPTSDTSFARLRARKLERRAVEAAIWGMPLIAFDAMRDAFFSVGAKYGDVCFMSRPGDWKLQLTTPNASSLYVWFNYNSKDGPLVLDFPAAVGAGLFGSICDAWQIPLADFGPEGEDEGRGGRYLLLPPGDARKPPAGYIPVQSKTYNGYAALRAIPVSSSAEDHNKALALVKQLKLYPLAKADEPPATNFIDFAGMLFDGIPKMDDTAFDRLARMVAEEPVQMRDLVAMAGLGSIGIGKRKPFEPDASTRAILKQASHEAHAGFMEAVSGVAPYWPTGNWGVHTYSAAGAKTGFTFETEDGLDIDNRGATFFAACAIPKKLGAATLYLTAAKDSDGAVLDGSQNYRLHVPAKVPAKQFWAMTVYDLETAAFIRQAPKIEVNSYQDMQKSADGSVDLYFGAQAPAGKESNWIYTAPGRIWFNVFRFYGPDQALEDKTWQLPEIEKLH